MRTSAPSPCPPVQLDTQTPAPCAGLAGFLLGYLIQSQDSCQNPVVPQFRMESLSQAQDKSGHGNAVPPLAVLGATQHTGGSQPVPGETGAVVALPPTRTVLLWVTFNSQQTRSVRLGLLPAAPRAPTGRPAPRGAPQGHVPPVPCPVPNFSTATQAPSATPEGSSRGPRHPLAALIPEQGLRFPSLSPLINPERWRAPRPSALTFRNNLCCEAAGAPGRRCHGKAAAQQTLRNYGGTAPRQPRHGPAEPPPAFGAVAPG